VKRKSENLKNLIAWQKIYMQGNRLKSQKRRARSKISSGNGEGALKQRFSVEEW